MFSRGEATDDFLWGEVRRADARRSSPRGGEACGMDLGEEHSAQRVSASNLLGEENLEPCGSLFLML